ncbi:MAG TPA: alkaline phosphatase PhoX [Candidatus Limnocylindrales bacterium]|nr:alkaline phosphatase PhoX [Candidatus Limnocylindrales bacterium]
MPRVPHRVSRRRALTSILATGLIAFGVVPANAASGGFKTAQPAMLVGVAPGSSVTPLLTVGDVITTDDGEFRLESIPDGISMATRGSGRVDLYINHETSRVPFPYTPAAATEGNSQDDFDNAQVSHVVLNRQSAGVLSGSYVIPSAANYQRFCSNFLATEANGFERDVLFTNEEAVDWINREGNAWPATIGADEARQAGAVVAFDVKSRSYRTIWGMGRHNHENDVAIPGYGHPVVVSGDDTFTNSPSQSQMYSYIAASAAAVWNDQGGLWAFVSDDPTRQRYEDFTIGDPTSVSGHFIAVPRLIATGRNADGTDLMAADVPPALGGPYLPPPSDGTWQRDPAGVGIDGPQWVLERWSQLHGVFRFVRLEDIAYDKRPGMSNVVYIADSGRGTTGAPENGRSTNGRIWRMVLDPSDPTQVDSLSILIEGDNAPVKDPGSIHQPDNLETTAAGSLLITEDPGSSQQFNPGEANATTARLWLHDLDSGVKIVAARVDQSADEGPTDVDAAAAARLGAWESSGILDASAAFGPGTFLIDVQAHSLWIEKQAGPDLTAPSGPDFWFKREGGQLLLIRIPGA